MSVTRIRQLSDEERGRFNEWAERWIAIGLRTGPADRAKFEGAVRECYRFAGIPWPGVVVWVPSPLVMAFAAPTAALVIELAHQAGRRPAPRQKAAGVFRPFTSHSAVGSAVGSAVDSAVGSAVEHVIANAWCLAFPGQFGVGGWYSAWSSGYWGGAFTSFFREVCRLELPGDLWDRSRAFEATMESACWWWPCRHFVMVCERPLEIHGEFIAPGNHRLHCERGPAVVWTDGWGVHALHGVRVPRWLVETPATQLDPRRLLQEPNAEVRREFVRKVGIERVCDTLGARVLDRQGDYELLALDLQDGRHRPYLKMRNPSIGVFHIEGVHPDCHTVQQALNWRAGDINRDWRPSQLT